MDCQCDHLPCPHPIELHAWRAAASFACFWFLPVPSPRVSPFTERLVSSQRGEKVAAYNNI